MARKPTSHVISRKREIIEAAAQIFAVKGYHAATLEDIAAEIGVTRAALYYYIKSKEELILEVSDILMKHMAMVIKVGKSQLTPKDKMRKVISLLIENSVANLDAVVVHTGHLSFMPARKRTLFRRRQEMVDKVIQDTLKAGVAEGSFLNDIDVRMTTFVIMGACSWVAYWYHPGSSTTSKQISDHFVRILEKGYLKNPV
jgi:AcrR family transcriptional regulator